MNPEEYKATAMTIAYLAACAVNGIVPDTGRITVFDPDDLIRTAELHKLAGITAQALDSAGIRTGATLKAKGNAIRKVILLDAEKNRILDRFEKAGIRYILLKGAVLKDLYPAVGMREMSDIDILIDAARMKDADAIMMDLEFNEGKTGGAHVEYNKDPVYNFELHRRLFSPFGPQKKLFDYYEDVWKHVFPDEEKKFGYRFSDEDFYLYITAHEYKHYVSGGTGLRSLLDIYVYDKVKGPTLNWEYIRQELDKLKLTDFEEKNRSLALALFAGIELNASQQTMLDYILSSGTYGTMTNYVENALAREGGGFLSKPRYVFKRVFLPMDAIKSFYPTFARYPVLLPFLPLYRLIRGIKQNGEKVKSEILILLKSKRKKVQ